MTLGITARTTSPPPPPDQANAPVPALGSAPLSVGDTALPDPIGEWRAHRVVMGVMVALLVLAALGFAGDGLAAERMIRTPDGAQVSYHAIVRMTAVTEISMENLPARSETCAVEMDLVGDAWHALGEIHPAPLRSIATAAGIRLETLRSPGAPCNIRVALTPSRIGVRDVRLRTATTVTTLRLVVLP